MMRCGLCLRSTHTTAMNLFLFIPFFLFLSLEIIKFNWFRYTYGSLDALRRQIVAFPPSIITLAHIHVHMYKRDALNVVNLNHVIIYYARLGQNMVGAVSSFTSKPTHDDAI